jgi:hypothetical protein
MNILRHCLTWLRAFRLALTITLFVMSPALADDTWTPLGKGWERYTNERFGTDAQVPRHLFRLVEPPPTSRDGREFKAEDGAALWISGSYGPYVVTDTFRDYKAWLLKQGELNRVSYKAERKNWLVLSGTKGASIVYRKVFEGCGAAHEIRVEYPA